MDAQMIIIRRATVRDAPAVRRLAALDDRAQPRGETMLAFVDGELAAARALDGRRAVADPFRRTSHLLTMLETQSEGRAA